MMTHLMGNDVGFRKLTSLVVVTPVKAMLEVAEERGVEVNLLIIRTVEGSHRRLSKPACRTRRPREYDERRGPILAVVLGEDVPPHDFGAPEHLGHELAGAIVWRAALRRTAIGRMRRMRGVLVDFGAANQNPWINSQGPADQSQHHNGADTQS